jgi:hypothetical protein
LGCLLFLVIFVGFGVLCVFWVFWVFWGLFSGGDAALGLGIEVGIDGVVADVVGMESGSMLGS